MLAVIAFIGLFNGTPAWCQPDDAGAGAKQADRQTRHEKQERRGDRARGERRHGRPPHAGIRSILNSDRVGTLSAAEIADASSSLKQLDTNRDEQVTRDELRSQFQSKGAKGANDKRKMEKTPLSVGTDGAHLEPNFLSVVGPLGVNDTRLHR